MIADQHFLRYYEQELRFVRDLAGEFASEHARVANRFGLDSDSCADPHVEWLLDGFAFLAARVQRKLDGDYAVFTQHLLDMVYPDALAPTPSTCIAALALAPDAPVPEEGFTVPRGTRLTARTVPGEATRCTFTTATDVTLWPVDLVAARYLGPAAAIEAGVPEPRLTRAALVLTLRTRAGVPFTGLGLDRLVLHLGSRDRIAHTLFEAMAGHTIGLAGRVAGSRDAPRRLAGTVERLGFADREALLPVSPRGYAGYRLLREYFVLPERFLFLAVTGLAPLVRAAATDRIELLVALDTFVPALENAVTESQFVLHATPAVNLFARRATPILPTPEDRDMQVIGDRVRPLDYEIHSIVEVTGHGDDGRELIRFQPFHGTSDGRPAGSVAYYGSERRLRILSDAEDRAGAGRSGYLGGDVFLTLADSPGAGGGGRPLRQALRRIDVEVLCTNRDLPLRMLLPHGEMHFSVDAGGPIAGARVIGLPSRPALPWATTDPGDGAPWGDTAWRLLGLLALNYHSIVDGPDGRGADALRALLRLHALGAAPQVARQVDGVVGVAAEPVTRRLPEPGEMLFGRGLQITLELVDSAFAEGSAFLLASVLEAFFRRHATINSFTETVLRTSERGEVMLWPAQAGQRHLL